MHFSIPDTEFYNDATGSYTGFNIHINGNFHCCLRYKQLHSFHEQLKRSIGNSHEIPSFPPKKFLPLTANQIEERRSFLEQYVQLIGQDPVLSKSELLLTFLLNAQQESSSIETRDITLDVYLMNNYRIEINCLTTDYSSKILEKACQKIDLPNDYIYYFSLFLMQQNNEGGVVLVRKLMDFESPYMSQRLMYDSQIVIRKSYWGPSYDSELFQDKIALNLLYVQTISDIENNWIITSNNDKEILQELRCSGNKKEYLEIARQLPSYGCIQFSNCIADYPSEMTEATIVIGNNELSIRTIIGMKIQETKFKVTRMRCWRVTTIHNDEEQQASSKRHKLELSFEYLMSAKSLRWVTINSENAMILSVCLQGMVEELINQKDGNSLNNLRIQRKNYTPLSYIRRDGQKIPEYLSSDSISSYNENETPVESFTLRQKFHNKISTTVFFRNGRESVHNEAFDDGIGDDDL